MRPLKSNRPSLPGYGNSGPQSTGLTRAAQVANPNARLPEKIEAQTANSTIGTSIGKANTNGLTRPTKAITDNSSRRTGTLPSMSPGRPGMTPPGLVKKPGMMPPGQYKKRNRLQRPNPNIKLGLKIRRRPVLSF